MTDDVFLRCNYSCVSDCGLVCSDLSGTEAHSRQKDPTPRHQSSGTARYACVKAPLTPNRLIHVLQNIFLTRGGLKVKLGDFGIARVLNR